MKSHQKQFLAKFTEDPVLLDQLINDPQPEVRLGTTKNPNLRGRHIEKLLDGGLDVRCEMTQNPNLTKEQVVKLANDMERSVRSGIAMNPLYKKFYP